jgi:hypothetical protein
MNTFDVNFFLAKRTIIHLFYFSTRFEVLDFSRFVENDVAYLSSLTSS